MDSANTMGKAAQAARLSQGNSLNRNIFCAFIQIISRQGVARLTPHLRVGELSYDSPQARDCESIGICDAF